MGQPKGGGYTKLPVQSEGQESILNQILAAVTQNLQGGNQNPLYEQATQALQGFLPGGQGFQPIQAEAQRNFKEQTIPSILNAFGSNSKSSSALNQALAGAGQNLNSSLAAQQAQSQLGAAGQALGASQLPYQNALSAAGLGLGTPTFAYQPTQMPFWQQLALAGTQAGGKVAAAKLGAG
jgi:hypothetical protein